MARLELGRHLNDDFDRIFDHLAQYDLEDAVERIGEISAALSVLDTNPLIGRPVQGGNRELVIGRGARGYVALYRYVQKIDMVFVVALRSQREAGYKHE